MAAEERAEAAERRAEAAESRAEAAELEAADSRTELETTAGELSRLRTRDGGSNGAAPEAPAEPPDADGSRDEPTDEADLPAAGPQPRAEPAAAQTADPASGGGPDDDFFTKLSEAKKAVESEG